jgi:cysteine desulfurase
VIKVNREGHLDLENLQRLMSERTALVSIMLANNETGTIFPIKKIATLAHEMGALVHTDATQALGKMLFNVGDLGVDFATLSGHKFYALRGVGILYARKGCSFHSQLLGGGQERARRGGTENILAIASLGEMCLTSKNDLEEAIVRMRTLRDLLETRVLDQVRDVSITALASPRTCNTSSLVVDGIDGETLLMNLDMKGFAVSAGSACSSGSAEPSAVLRAMGLSFAEAQSTLRISLGWNSNEDEVVQFANTLAETVARLRGM